MTRGYTTRLDFLGMGLHVNENMINLFLAYPPGRPRPECFSRHFGKSLGIPELKLYDIDLDQRSVHGLTVAGHSPLGKHGIHLSPLLVDIYNLIIYRMVWNSIWLPR